MNPLAGLWWAEDPEVFRARDKTAWGWTLIIVQPDWITILRQPVTAAT